MLIPSHSGRNCQLCGYPIERFWSNAFNWTLSIKTLSIERFQSNAFDWTLSIKRFQSNTFNRRFQLKRFRSNAFNRTLSIKRFQSNAFERFQYIWDVRITGNFFHCASSTLKLCLLCWHFRQKLAESLKLVSKIFSCVAWEEWLQETADEKGLRPS